MGKHRHIGCLCFGARAARLAESDTIQAQEQCSEANEQSGNQQDPEQRLAGEGGTDEEELAHEDTERWKTSDCDDAKHETPTEHRVGFGESPHVGDLLRALALRNVTQRRRSPTSSANAWSCAASRRNWR